MSTVISAAQIAARLGQPPPTGEQVAVIEATRGPLLVVAGAGSGKTETMAARVVWLVANGLVAPDRVLGLTFTRKAAGELADRVRSRLRQLRRSDTAGDAEADEPTVATYHSYAASVVADHGLRLGVEPGSRLLGEAASWQLASAVVEGWDDSLADAGRAPSTVVDSLIALGAECAEHLVSPADLGEHLATVLAGAARLPRNEAGGVPAQPSRSSGAGKALAALAARRHMVPLLEAYLRRKRELEVLDFGDQVALAARLAATAPEVGAGERARFDVVLLDEYQDTSHAQLELLRHLFGGGHAVTAVGDPHQSIYGWRGASAGNLDRFRVDFPASDGKPASVAWLSTSWRNDHVVLDVANALADPLRASSVVEVKPLQARPDAGAGLVSARWSQTVDDENGSLAADLAAIWRADGARPTVAVLCRKRSQFAGVEKALRAEGLPVEVVGLGGLLERPEVGDVVATLQVLHDPSRGDALVRLLTGPRWRIGPRDLETLGEWARTLHRRHPRDQALRSRAVDPDVVDETSIVDALDSLPRTPWVGQHGRGFSPSGHARLSRLSSELAALRRQAALPLPDLVAEIERTLMLDVELASVPGTSHATARAQLDAFADVAASFSDGADRPTIGAFLSWLAAAAVRERGLTPAEESVDDTALAPEATEPSRTAVQVLTVHAAKGLEWDVVAVPGLVEGSFPAGTSSQGQDTAGGWLAGVASLPYGLRGDSASLPVWSWRSASHLKELEASVTQFRLACGAHEEAEERRLAYVASTRARRRLLLSGAFWGDGVTARRPSRYLLDVASRFADHPRVQLVGLSEKEIEAPEAESNPRLADPFRLAWPYDPLGGRRPIVRAAADAVLAAASGPVSDAAPGEWGDEVDLLLAERGAASSPVGDVVLPVHLSASRAVQLADDPVGLAEQIRRPMPVEPRPATRRGTAFHGWLEERFRAETLVDLDELPGIRDDGAAPDEELPRLRETFLASEWATRTPVAVEVAVETPVAGVMLRGRVDAVFATDDGGFDVVDWKTGSPPTGRHRDAAAVQLAVYRLAWARLQGIDVDRVGAAFFYASTGETVRPVARLDEAELLSLLTAVPTE
ncbi:MAG TPA: ATP-dependent DNA helicase [Actinomycetales bacterium]|nr:ATP-dependent DNA helicase [Actinomycetales bacterium]